MSQPVGSIVQQGQVVVDVETLARLAVCSRQKPPTFSAGLELRNVTTFQVIDAIAGFQFLAIGLIVFELYDLAGVRPENLVFLITGLQVKRKIDRFSFSGILERCLFTTVFAPQKSAIDQRSWPGNFLQDFIFIEYNLFIFS